MPIRINHYLPHIIAQHEEIVEVAKGDLMKARRMMRGFCAVKEDLFACRVLPEPFVYSVAETCFRLRLDGYARMITAAYPQWESTEARKIA
tara:strand:+ start:1552 stop:1824 length:273 start_codon:yes stop_codon:yes gene_type:complete